MQRRSAWRAVLAAAAVAAAMGCSAVLGIGDVPTPASFGGDSGQDSTGGEASGHADQAPGPDTTPPGDVAMTDAAVDAPPIPVTCADAAAAHSYVGCEFWPTSLANPVDPVFDFAAVVTNPGVDPATVTVTGPNATSQMVTVQPGQLQKIYLPWVAALKGNFNVNGNLGIFSASIVATASAYHLVSSAPVAVYQFNALEFEPVGGPPGKDWDACAPMAGAPCFSYTNDASLLLPTTALTTSYRVSGQKGWSTTATAADAQTTTPQTSSYFAVTATANQTTVTVHTGPNTSVLAGAGIAQTGPGAVLTISLNAGDVAEIAMPGGGGFDPSGSLVLSNNPVQVITGVPCIFLPDNVAACDHVEQSVIPAEALGDHYVVQQPTGPAGNVVPHIVRFYGNEDGTQLVYSPSRPPSCPITMNAGDVFDCGEVSLDFEVTGDKSFAISSFQLGATLVDPLVQPPAQRGDPSQTVFPPVEQFLPRYVFLAPTDYTVSYIDVTMTAGTSVVLDGSPIWPSAVDSGITFTPIGANGFGVLRLPLGAGVNGAHIVDASRPIAVQVIGYAPYTSYEYPAGLGLQRITPAPTH